MLDLKQFNIGATAAIMTSMGLIAGLSQDANAKLGIISGLLIIAVADNISDSFSIHMYRESEGASTKEVAISTVGNFVIRFVLALSFAGIVFLCPATTAFVLSCVWGISLLALLSYRIALRTGKNPLMHTLSHVSIACIVIICSKFLGNTLLQLVAH